MLAVMRWAREHDVLVAVRGGGHNVAGTGTCDDGLVIDLLPMKGVRVEPASGTVRCQASLAWADLDYETQTFGLATTAAWSLRPGSAGSPSAVASAGCSALWPGLRTTFRLHEVGPLVTAGLVAYPYERAVEVLRGWHSAVVALPEAVHRTPHA